jgi:hypothetical protein
MKMNFKDLRDRSSTSLKSSFNPKREILHSKEKRERSVLLERDFESVCDESKVFDEEFPLILRDVHRVLIE